ncbi:hypothetical protein ATI61_10734 [Archangium gephyra]|uniref:Lipoprotein n=1 Tax=Archangium gephyra TaxID=48 RepID=A0AAC8TJ68_9BACT|nr:hypothetical protein [Archangium gephyra]AKJ07590.1 Hypothetical protein AA314_09216 [Archangium gephyra]REG29347.1 hypothetical protein ATI61_10734 [Archangium gephyra]
MRKTLLLIAFGATGCIYPHTQFTDTDLERQAPFGVINIDFTHRYIIDPRTESCFLRTSIGEGGAMVAVPCAKLKKNVPEAAAFITWEPSDAAAQ